MKPVRYHPAADAELDESVGFYENRQAGLGLRLAESTLQETDYIQRYPTRCQNVDKNVRKRRVSNFPYSLIFAVRKDYLYVVAFMHDRREPGYWKARLSDES